MSVVEALATSQIGRMAARLLQVIRCKVLAWFSQSNSLWVASGVSIKFLTFPAQVCSRSLMLAQFASSQASYSSCFTGCQIFLVKLISICGAEFFVVLNAG